MLPLSDPRGIRTATLRVNDKDVALESGTGHPSYTRGLQSKTITTANADNPKEVQLALELIARSPEELAAMRREVHQEVAEALDMSWEEYCGFNDIAV